MRLNRGHSPEHRFWSRIDKTDGCWNWLGHKDGKGYGFIRVNSTQRRTHQHSWILHNGPIPNGLYVCHTCDNPGCVNPAHLFLGTHADNQRDKAIKGRGGRKLHTEDIVGIRRLLATGKSQTSIAKLYGVTPSHISYISTGKIWRFVCA